MIDTNHYRRRLDEGGAIRPDEIRGLLDEIDRLYELERRQSSQDEIERTLGESFGDA